jgi:hypothetical protein
MFASPARLEILESKLTRVAKSYVHDLHDFNTATIPQRPPIIRCKAAADYEKK